MYLNKPDNYINVIKAVYEEQQLLPKSLSQVSTRLDADTMVWDASSLLSLHDWYIIDYQQCYM